MRVVLSTIGRFHTFDLARQMHKRSALVAVFSGYPWFKLKHEQIPRHLVYTFPWLHAPYMRFPHGIFGDGFTRDWEWWDRDLFDRHTALHMPDCDIYSGLSSSTLRSGMEAKRRGARYVCDRGSAHIRVQDRILREECDRQGIAFRGIDRRIIEREEAEYAAANAITVPSSFALRSFHEEGAPAQKVARIPYGVDLSRFYPVARPDDRSFEVLFAGAVSIRKGIPYLLKAFELLEHPNKRLTIAGQLSSEMKDRVRAFASSRNDVDIVGHVPQAELPQYMSRARVMVLASVEEGLALVQAQAMACGCPVIATTNTGAEDLFTDGVEGFIVPIRNPDAIACCLQKLANDWHLRDRMGTAAVAKVKEIGGWDLYGERMYRLFKQLIA